MKRIILLAASIFIMTALFTISYADDQYFKMTYCKNSSFTLEWSYPAESFVVKDTDGNMSDVITDNKCDVQAVPGYINIFSLYYLDDNGELKDTGLYTQANTRPSKYKRYEFGVTYISSSYVNISFANDDSISGAELEVTDIITGTKKTFNNKGNAFLNVKTKPRNPYKIRMRAFIYNRSDKKKYYSSWSSYNSFCDCQIPYYESNKNGVVIKLKGIKGIEKYKVYVSASGKKGTYKLSRTCKPSRGKTTSYIINKYGSSTMKSGKKYYVQIVPVIDCGKNSYKSQITSDFNFIN